MLLYVELSFLFCTQGGIFVWARLPENIDANGKLLLFTNYTILPVGRQGNLFISRTLVKAKAGALKPTE